MSTKDAMQESVFAAFEAFEYQDGEEMKQNWNAAFVIFAYLLACVSSYSAVHMLDHGLWRNDEMKNRAEAIKYPAALAASMLGFGSVWCMHFVSPPGQHFLAFVSQLILFPSIHATGGNVGRHTETRPDLL